MQWLGNGLDMLFDTKMPWKQLPVTGDGGGSGDLSMLGHSRQEGVKTSARAGWRSPLNTSRYPLACLYFILM